MNSLIEIIPELTTPGSVLASVVSEWFSLTATIQEKNTGITRGKLSYQVPGIGDIQFNSARGGGRRG